MRHQRWLVCSLFVLFGTHTRFCTANINQLARKSIFSSIIGGLENNVADSALRNGQLDVYEAPAEQHDSSPINKQHQVASIPNDKKGKLSTVTKRFSSHPIQSTALLMAISLLPYPLWKSREQWLVFFDSKAIQSKILNVLHRLDSLPQKYSYSIYFFSMSVWETLGLSTIPVETAAGMVFGWPAFPLSAMGKLFGALVAFGLMRYGTWAERYVQPRLPQHPTLTRLADLAVSSPLTAALLIKSSGFPETIKNVTAGLLRSIRLWMFVLGMILHGWLFSGLWTWVGVDTALRLENPDTPVQRALQFLVSMVLVHGFVISPLVLAYFLRPKDAPQVPSDTEKASDLSH